jgi:sulfur carrier protein
MKNENAECRNSAVTVNGKPHPIGDAVTLAQLLVQLGIDATRMAVEHNATIIHLAQRDHTPVHAGDHVEIIHFVGGG